MGDEPEPEPEQATPEQATPEQATPEQAAAASSIGAVARGRKERKQLQHQSESATMISRHAKGRLARRRKEAMAAAGNGDGDGAAETVGDGAAEPDGAGDASDGGDVGPASSEDAEAARLAAQQRIAATARGRLDRKAVVEKKQAAGTIGRVAKGRAARKQAKAMRKLHAAEGGAPVDAAAEPPAPVASPDLADAPPAPLVRVTTKPPTQPPIAPHEQQPPPHQPQPPPTLPLKFAKPPVTYRFIGRDGSVPVERGRAGAYWQTYTIKVEGYHSTQQTKLVLSIEVHGSLQNLVSVEPVAQLDDADWKEVATTLAKCNKHALTIADYGALFTLSQSVFNRLLK